MLPVASVGLRSSTIPKGYFNCPLSGVDPFPTILLPGNNLLHEKGYFLATKKPRFDVVLLSSQNIPMSLNVTTPSLDRLDSSIWDLEKDL